MLALVPLAITLVCTPAELSMQMAAIAGDARGRVGAAALVVETGELVALHGGERFPMQSVYKLPIVMAALQRVDRGTLALDRRVHVSGEEMVPSPVHSPLRDRAPRGITVTVRDLMRAALVDSDGSASDALLRLVPVTEVTAFVRSLGVDELEVATSERDMARAPEVQDRNWVTPTGAVRLLGALQQGRALSSESRARVLAWLAEVQTGPNRLRALLPPTAKLQHKTGTDATRAGLTRATNDIGLVTLPNGNHLAIAVLVADSTADERTREGVIARIGRAAWDCAAGHPR